MGGGLTRTARSPPSRRGSSLPGRWAGQGARPGGSAHEGGPLGRGGPLARPKRSACQRRRFARAVRSSARWLAPPRGRRLAGRSSGRPLGGLARWSAREGRWPGQGARPGGSAWARPGGPRVRGGGLARVLARAGPRGLARWSAREGRWARPGSPLTRDRRLAGQSPGCPRARAVGSPERRRFARAVRSPGRWARQGLQNTERAGSVPLDCASRAVE